MVRRPSGYGLPLRIARRRAHPVHFAFHVRPEEPRPLEQIFDPDLRVSVRRHSAPGRPLGSLLWVHGLGESGLCFETLLLHPRLGAWDQLAVDLPGYGRSPWPTEPQSLSGHAELLARFIERRLREPPIVIGHSMGGVIGQLLAETEGERMHALCNVEGNISPGDCTFSRRAAAFDGREFAEQGFARLRQEVYDGGVEHGSLRTYFASLCLADPRTFHRNALELVEVSEREDLAQRLAVLQLPRIYVQGRPDGGPQRSHDLLCRAGLPPSVVEPAGHWPFLDQPDRFLDLLLPFLEIT